MPVCWLIEGGLVRIASSGEPTFEEWSAAVDGALASPEFCRGMSVVHDLREVSRAPTPGEARARVASLCARAASHDIPRWAIVVAGQAHYGMARLAQIVSEFEVRHTVSHCVFTDLGEALAWARGRSGSSAADSVA